MTAESGMPQRVAVIGQGYVGLPLSMLAVQAGFQVTGLDVDPVRAARLQGGDSYVDDVSADELQAALSSGRYTPTGDYAAVAGFDIAVITVPTPLLRRSPDLSYVLQAAGSLAPYVTRGALVVLESTTYPGTTEGLVRPALEEGSGLAAGPDFSLAYSPERVDPGNLTWPLAATPKVVAGIDDKALAAVQDFYRKLVADVIPVSSMRTAELSKLLENTFRHVNIGLVNEFAVFAHELGIDIWEVVRAAATKPFGFMPFYPGPGVGGHCLPIDPTYLSWHVQQETGRRFRFVELANDINEQMPAYVVQRVAAGLNRRGRAIRGSRILLLGLAYKRNSSDARESPATVVARLLAAQGAQLTAVDDEVAPGHLGELLSLVSLTRSAVAQADAVVLLTDHDGVDYNLVQREARYILDCRNRLASANVERL
jgi:UDP-N-acetyl-D-glucosamine dehydrogenase